jgi:hypothetical protein
MPEQPTEHPMPEYDQMPEYEGDSTFVLSRPAQLVDFASMTRTDRSLEEVEMSKLYEIQKLGLARRALHS